jgi:AcrR family transcriptional regulator
MNSQNKKELIKQTALKLFASNGFEATPVREIAKQANVNLAMISYYFSSKEHLLEEIISEKLNDIKIRDTEIKKTKSAEESLKNVIKLLLQKTIKNQAFFNLLHSELSVKQRVLTADIYYKVKEHNDAIIKMIIDHGIKEKFFKRNSDAEIISIFILGPYINFVLNKRYYKEKLKLTTEEEFENYINTSLLKTITTSAINLLK